MENTIVIFTMIGCPFCLELKNSLIELDIPYLEFEIEKHKSVWRDVIKQTGYRNLPTVFIKEGGTDIGPIFIPGRDFNSNEEIVKIIQKYI